MDMPNLNRYIHIFYREISLSDVAVKANFTKTKKSHAYEKVSFTLFSTLLHAT